MMGRARGQHAHREDGGDLVQGRNEDANLADAGGEKQGPRWLSVGFAVAENLRTEQPSQGAETLGLLVSLFQSWRPVRQRQGEDAVFLIL